MKKSYRLTNKPSGRGSLRGLLLAAAVFFAACADDPVAPAPRLLGPVDQVGDERPAEVYYPDDYDAGTAYPLVVMLHGFSGNAWFNDLIFELKDRVTTHQFVLIAPEGTANPEGDQFWNATNECCDFFNQEPDDVAYLSSLISQSRAHFNIDPARVVLLGHSNGGYMANRYACDQREGRHARVTRIVNLAGLSFVNADDCQAEQPVEVLHIHGTADDRVYYESNVTDPSLSNPDVVEEDERLRAGAFELAARWAERAACDPTPEVSLAAYDLSVDVAGLDTDSLIWTNCRHGASTLMRANGVGHLWVDATDAFRELVVDFVVR